MGSRRALHLVCPTVVATPPHTARVPEHVSKGGGAGRPRPKVAKLPPHSSGARALAAMSAESLVRNSLPGGRGEGAFQCYFPHGCCGRRRRQNTVVSVSDKKVFCPFPSLFFLRQFFLSVCVLDRFLLLCSARGGGGGGGGGGGFLHV